MASEKTRKIYQHISMLIFVVSIIATQQYMNHHVVINAFFHNVGHAVAGFLASSTFHAILPVLLIGTLFFIVIAINQHTQNKSVATKADSITSGNLSRNSGLLSTTDVREWSASPGQGSQKKP